MPAMPAGSPRRGMNFQPISHGIPPASTENGSSISTKRDPVSIAIFEGMRDEG